MPTGRKAPKDWKDGDGWSGKRIPEHFKIDEYEYPINELRKKCEAGDEKACKELEEHYDKLDSELEKLMSIVEGGE